MAKIDHLDKAHILLLNNHAASMRLLAELSSGPARDFYVYGMGKFDARTEVAVEAAIRRAGA